MNRDGTGKLQIILFSAETNCTRTLSNLFGRSYHDVFWENEEEFAWKYANRGYAKEVFCKLTGWHLATSLQINFFTDSFQGF